MLSPVADRWHHLLFVLLSGTGFEPSFFSLGLLTNDNNCLLHIATWTMHLLGVSFDVFVCVLFPFEEWRLLFEFCFLMFQYIFDLEKILYIYFLVSI